MKPKSAQSAARQSRGQSVEQFYECDQRPILKAKLAACIAELDKREPERRAEKIDCDIANEKRRRVRFHPQGTLIRIDKFPGWEEYENPKAAKRGKILGFFGKSRHRLQSLCATVERNQRPLFVTLTYPAYWPDDEREWKAQLDTFGKRMRRRWKGSSAIWKMEFQERGAPHFHLIVFGVDFMHHQWLAEAWYEICGTGDPDHLRAGTSVEEARTSNAVMAYAAKKYLGKVEIVPPGVDCGRLWGVIGRKFLPVSPVVEVTITKRTHQRLHRLFRRFMRSKGVRWKSGGGITLFTQHHLQWLRCIEWAETGGIGQPLDHRHPYDRQPF